jgi:hypothetical protein
VNSLFKRKKHHLRVHITLAIEGGTAAAVAIVASTFASSGTHTLFSQKRDVNQRKAQIKRHDEVGQSESQWLHKVQCRKG